METQVDNASQAFEDGLVPPDIDVDLYDPAVQGNLHHYAAAWRAIAPRRCSQSKNISPSLYRTQV